MNSDMFTFEAAVVIVRNKQGQILGASRKNNSSQYGFPGGKVDPGEGPLTAATRELLEETGVRMRKSVYLGCLYDGEYITYCYYATEWDGEPQSMEPLVHVKWLSEEEIQGAESAFPDYNAEMMKRLRDQST